MAGPGAGFVRYFDAITPGYGVPLRVTEMTDQHAVWWDAHIQPDIDMGGQRADCGWEWPKIRRWGLALGGALAHAGSGHVYRALTLGIERIASGEFFPFGMLLLVEGYPALDDGNQSSVFVWYLADAPRGVLQQHLTPDEIPKACASLLLDAAVTVSFDRGYQGRVGLHAAPSGGAALVNWYQRRKMTRLSPQASLPRLRRLVNDGRYFYYDELGALAAHSAFDPYR